MFQFPERAWPPQRRGIERTIDALQRGKSVCLYSPTGGGKTFCGMTLMRWAASLGRDSCFYLNRRLLLGQTAQRFAAEGMHYGVRAANYEEQWDPTAPYQICSIDTERARCIKSEQWSLHPAGLVIVDEAHLQRTDAMKQVLAAYREAGAWIVGLTATPIGLSEWYDELVISGTMSEYRACKALVPAVVKSIEQPDMSKVKRNATGEYILDGRKRRVYTQTIVGSVIDRWKLYNPDARPTMLYAPGVAESVWFTEKFSDLGVSWAHIDANDAVVDGIRTRLTRTLWDEILQRYREGDIKGLSSRFKLREGLDVPATFMAILATPIGSLASYIQTAGRVVRYSPETPDQVIITDHGANYWRHGSPNHDRPWDKWWSLSEYAVGEMHQAAIKDGATPEPIRCPKCEMERKGGSTCPGCGHTHEKSKRMVVMENGDLVDVEGNLIAPRQIRRKADTEELWKKLVFGYRKKRLEKSFDQLYGYFHHLHHYQPPRDLPLMPKSPEDWKRPVYAVDFRDLHSSKVN